MAAMEDINRPEEVLRECRRRVSTQPSQPTPIPKTFTKKHSLPHNPNSYNFTMLNKPKKHTSPCISHASHKICCPEVLVRTRKYKKSVLNPTSYLLMDDRPITTLTIKPKLLSHNLASQKYQTIFEQLFHKRKVKRSPSNKAHKV